MISLTCKAMSTMVLWLTYIVCMVCVSYLSESYTVQDGVTDIEDVGLFVQNNEKTINSLVHVGRRMSNKLSWSTLNN